MNSLKKEKKQSTGKIDQQHKKRIRALFILVALIFCTVVLLLGIHAFIVQSGSFFYDLYTNIFLGIAGLAIFSGIVFPLVALIMIPLMPIIMIYFYYKNK
jgi:archaellum biogenesis protein FlaJ (TadC family)